MNAKTTRNKTFPQIQHTTINLDDLLGASKDTGHLDANWNEVEPGIIATLVYCATFLGGTVQFGSTKNNKAYTIKLYIGRAYDPIYFDGDDAGRAEMAALAQSFIEKLAGSS